MTTDPASEVAVCLPRILAALFPGCPLETRVRAATVAEAIAALNRSWPGIQDRLCEECHTLRRHIRVYVRGEIAGLRTHLSAGDEMFIITAISGG